MSQISLCNLCSSLSSIFKRFYIFGWGATTTFSCKVLWKHFYIGKYKSSYCHIYIGTIIYFLCIRNTQIFLFFLADSFISEWDTKGREEYSANWIIHGYKDSQSQGIKGICKQLNKNKTLTTVWPTAGLFCMCKHSRWERWEGLESWGEDWGTIWFQASKGASHYRAHFIRIHFQLSDVLNTLSEEHNPVKSTC